MPKKTLNPNKHNQLDLFICNNVELSMFVDDLASMEHRLFALKSGDKKDRYYV